MVKRYLDMVSLKEAKDTIKREFTLTPGRGKATLMDAHGKISAGPVFSKYSVPMLHLSAMDGIAVKSEETKGAAETKPVLITDFKRLNTGNIIPSGYDAVIMIEDTWEAEGGFDIRKAAAPYQHVRPVGEDIGESEMIIPSLHRIRFNDTAALASYGISEVDVLSLRAGIIPTGSELLEPGSEPEPGKVIDSNSIMAGAMLSEAGVDFTRYPIVEDDFDLIKNAVKKGIEENDFLITSAGSSAGTKDHTASVIAELGEVLIHGIAIKPGKPAIIGRINGKPVIGLPGYPLAAMTIMREIVMPMVESYGFKVPYRYKTNVELSTSLHSPIGTDEFVMMSVGKVGGRYIGVPMSRGAGVQMSAVRANAYIKIPAESEGISSGEETEANFTVTPDLAENSLLIVGSHDPCLDYLASLASEKGIQVFSVHSGSMGGVLALKKSYCHAAPVHLLSDDGDYNVPYIRKYLAGEEISLFCVAEREQGIASISGAGFDEITELSYVNRQKGSGTRILLDYILRENGISPSAVNGYEREMTTHLDVALAVKNGEADGGMCVYSAAKALGLKFSPVAKERYELAIPAKFLEDERIKAILEIIKSDKFRAQLTSLGGYDTSKTGDIRKV
ncbi:molybdopterin biosynthesis protein [Methanoplanus limicola]|uniref:Molybdenum cofactor synthesis domain protein n=1 Tax=Methanoplanus limicola DSM 2279 TaxID=937775 RepID=H1YY19_9EURY|nr:molybdopterin biosynthesis protein [Methanoplanus limicola]EHQ36954.1 molybdenum cofactor synthesis domain protein [Methanoplanus limicola DSM 2279]